MEKRQSTVQNVMHGMDLYSLIYASIIFIETLLLLYFVIVT